jgi:hypothetical protein
MKRLIFGLLGFLSVNSFAGVGGLFIMNTNSLQPSATLYVTSGTIRNLNTNVVKFPDGSTQVTAALSSATLTGLKTSLDLTPVTVNTSTINFDSHGFTNYQSPTSVANIGLNPNATYFILNSNSLITGSTFYTSSGTVNGPLTTFKGVLQAILLPSTTQAFSLVNVSSHQIYVTFKSSGTTWWKLGNDVTNLGVPTFDIFNATTGVKDISISTGDILTMGANVVLTPLTASRPLKLDASKQITSGLIDVTADITGTVPNANLPTNLVHTNVQETISSSKVFTATQSFNAGLTASTAVISNLVSGNCVQAGANGLLTDAGSPCGSGGGGSIFNQNTLQDGATFYVSSGTVQMQLGIGPDGPTVEPFTGWNFMPGIALTHVHDDSRSGVLYVGEDVYGNGGVGINTGFPQAALDVVPGPSFAAPATLFRENNLGIAQMLFGSGQTGVINYDTNTSSFVVNNPLTFLSSMTLSGGYLVQNSAPTNGQVLKFDGSVWAPGIDNASGSSIYNATSTAGFPFGLTASSITVPEILDPASVAKIDFEFEQPCFYTGNGTGGPLNPDGFWGCIGAGFDVAGHGGNGQILYTSGALEFDSLIDTFTSSEHDSVSIVASTGMAVASSYILRLPIQNGQGNLYNDGTGQLSFVASAGGGGGLQLQPATTYVNVTTFSAVIPGVTGGIVVTSTRTQIPGSTSVDQRQPWEMWASSKCLGAETQFSSTGQYQDFCSISLDPGLYFITAMYYGENGGGTNTQFAGAISKDSGNSCSDCTGGDNYIETSGPVSGAHQETLTLFFSTGIATTTRFYLKGYMSYSGAAPYLRSSITAYKR